MRWPGWTEPIYSYLLCGRLYTLIGILKLITRALWKQKSNSFRPISTVWRGVCCVEELNPAGITRSMISCILIGRNDEFKVEIDFFSPLNLS